jgi:hypothetical protein
VAGTVAAHEERGSRAVTADRHMIPSSSLPAPNGFDRFVSLKPYSYGFFLTY